MDVERTAARAEAAYRHVVNKLEEVLAGSEEEEARNTLRQILGRIAVTPDGDRLIAVYKQPEAGESWPKSLMTRATWLW